MSDVSKITVGNSTYDIKDADARQVLDALGTAATKDSTNSVTAGSTNLVESGAVKTAIDAAVSSAYHAAGPKTVAELVSSLLIEANEGNVYNMTTSGVTSSDFVEGYGYPIRIGDNVGICKINNVYKFDLLSGFVDLTNYVQKSATSGLLKNDGSVDTTITGAVSANTSAISSIKDGSSIDSFGDVETALADKVDKVTGKGLSTNDYTDEDKEKVDKIDVLSTSVSGNPLSFTTKSAQLANNAEIVLEPIQAGSGDPSPTNVREISGYNEIKINSCGKNLINYFEPGGIDSNTGQDADNPNLKRSGFILIKSNTTYILSGINTTFRLFYYNKNREFINSEVKESPIINIDNPNIFYIRFHANISTIVSEPQLELGSIATTYEPYNPATDITLKLNETVYGGKLNVRSGELVVDRGIVDLGDLNWSSNTSSTYGTYFKSTSIQTYGIKYPANGFVNPMPNAACSSYKNTGRTVSDFIDNTVVFDGNLAAVLELQIKDSQYNDPTAFKTAVTGQKLVYPLATPYTIQLTPHEISLLLGDNVVTTNGATINLDYNANGEMASLSDLSGVGESVNALSEYIEGHPMRIVRIGYGNGKTNAEQFAEMVPYIQALKSDLSPYKYYNSFIKIAQPIYYPTTFASNKMEYTTFKIMVDSMQVVSYILAGDGSITVRVCSIASSGITIEDVSNNVAEANMDLYIK